MLTIPGQPMIALPQSPSVPRRSDGEDTFEERILSITSIVADGLPQMPDSVAGIMATSRLATEGSSRAHPAAFELHLGMITDDGVVPAQDFVYFSQMRSGKVSFRLCSERHMFCSC